MTDYCFFTFQSVHASFLSLHAYLTETGKYIYCMKISKLIPTVWHTAVKGSLIISFQQRLDKAECSYERDQNQALL